MAAAEAISPQVTTLSVPEAQALADRLCARSTSPLFDGPPHVRTDMCMASRAIRSLISQVDRLASECEDRAYLLRNI